MKNYLDKYNNDLFEFLQLGEATQMSKVSEFFGITIEINPLENYLSHVIASYRNYEAMFSARSGVIMDGEFPEDQSRLVTAWVILHQKEIDENWNGFLTNKNYTMKQIPPLT